MPQYRIVIEKAGRNYSAYAPDLGGCVATGRTERETIRNMREAIDLHLQGLREDHLSIPTQRNFSDPIEITD
ncbi:MAG TPA: type II toxin-antitoxin system HicB family antitoxin [Anaerolineales bacterium]|nr:type II toxin-antitoxin system HicB family antitoxin [Anaerolineales bacterium]